MKITKILYASSVIILHFLLFSSSANADGPLTNIGNFINDKVNKAIGNEQKDSKKEPAKESYKPEYPQQEPVKELDVTNFDIRGVKLGMSLRDIKQLFPNAEIKIVRDYSKQESFLDKEVRLTFPNDKLHSMIDIKLPKSQWSKGATDIYYRSDVPNRSDVISKIINKFGQPTVFKNEDRWMWWGCYGNICEQNPSRLRKIGTPRRQCGKYMNAYVKNKEFILKLVDECPMAKYHHV